MTPEQELAVRELLADARETGPMPAEVADRLEAVLTGLRQDTLQDTRPDTSPVTSISAAAARRRRTTRLLLAAAVVVVAGVGLGQAWRGGPGVSASSDSAAGSAGAETASGLAQAPDTQSDKDAGADLSGLPVVRADHLAADARALQPTGGPAGDAATSRIAGCVLPDTGAGVVVAVSYDGAPAALVYQPPTADAQVVDLYPCGAAGAVRSVTVPAP